MKLPWRDINDIIEKKDFEAFLKRSAIVNLLYFIVGSISGAIIWKM